ncbi:MAG: hypothetical protein U0526_03590 [Candidatus Saccharibacteria bacterium]
MSRCRRRIEPTVLLNAGALPVLELTSQRTIGATLGDESIARSMITSVIGILAVVIFMIMSYRWAGVIASMALIIYVIFNIAVFKLSSAVADRFDVGRHRWRFQWEWRLMRIF